jgi:hypothetical protein
MKNQDKIDKWSCEIAGLIYDKYVMNSYGIGNCNINYTEGDLSEKIIRRSVLNFGTVCEDLPKRLKKEAFQLDDLFMPVRITRFAIPLPPSPQNINQVITKLIPVPQRVAYQFIQTFPLEIWMINHNLSFYPNVSVVDLDGNQIEGAIQYVTQTSVGGLIRITFSEPLAGSAYLS